MSTSNERELAPVRRLAMASGAWSLLWLATPGVLGRDGSLALAAIALVPWSLAASRPGRRAFLVEWLAAAIGLSAQMYWSTFVLWITLLAVAIVPALYMACAGALLRALVKRVPLVVAAPIAWTAFETLRLLVEPPFGFAWMRLGHFAHAHPWLAAGARVAGVGGVGFALAAFAAAVAVTLHARRVRIAAAAGLLPGALVVLAGVSTSPPPMVDGPHVLLVQPSFPQERKMRALDADAMFGEQVELTSRALADATARNEPVPDLVAWAETMFPYPLATADLRAAIEAGVRTGPFGEPEYEPRFVAAVERVEAELVARELLGRGAARGVLPSGTAFVAGVELHGPRDGAVRRFNSVVLWGNDGTRLGAGSKVHLVPGGEHMMGLERFGWIRSIVEDLTGGYMPNLAADERTGVLAFTSRTGREYRFSVLVCFDNTFDDPFTEPLRRGDVDFHFVASNEAWYRESFEYDQMIAFTRLAALQTARAVVRATNSGITIVVGPDGRDVARLEVAGRDRMVAGTLRSTVPVPAAAHASERTLYVRAEALWIGLWLAAPLLALAVARLVGARAVTRRA